MEMHKAAWNFCIFAKFNIQSETDLTGYPGTMCQLFEEEKPVRQSRYLIRNVPFCADRNPFSNPRTP
jgi:hypothetical protein